MSRYIYFTEEQKEKACHTDIVELLMRKGETLKRSGSEYEWRDGSGKVTIRGHLWYHQYEQKGGNAVDFVRRFYNKSYPEAVDFLLSGSGDTLTKAAPLEKLKGNFELPPRNDNMQRMFAYLMFYRGIDKNVLSAFVHAKLIYESEKYHNAVFVGYDRDNIPRHAHMRGTGSESTYKGNAPNSQPEYSFHWLGIDEKLYLFEAPIDMLSFISMHQKDWRKHSYAASCSVSDRVLFQCLKDNASISKVYICFDNDEPGQTAAKRISDKLFTMGIQSEILVSINKDWNEDLLNPKEREEVCQALQC